jgi:hypothetical protein
VSTGRLFYFGVGSLKRRLVLAARSHLRREVHCQTCNQRGNERARTDDE